MEYTTQMDAARKGIFTPEMAKVAEKEHLEPKKLMALMAEGKVIIPCNKVHTCIEPNGLGSMLKTKINVNLGTSRDLTDLNMELEKVNHAVEMGAEAIMDLSSFGDTQKFRRKLTHECPAMIGTVRSMTRSFTTTRRSAKSLRASGLTLCACMRRTA